MSVRSMPNPTGSSSTSHRPKRSYRPTEPNKIVLYNMQKSDRRTITRPPAPRTYPASRTMSLARIRQC
ncbi:hypothetical protein M404DRAFT_764639 [Pisolithus tinctorius Marx 270]|uniref:Uncharacterized protein n=1 Tax=Pisolithus tinctorius Marx 270 TaxID=870435 RepID=A0A0C3IUD5_PISTI|nr:hypothetical protein M404DRAFT_764639 [Pisolithus tinctorius Marx 270]